MFAALTVSSGIFVVMSRKLIYAIIFFALASVGSAIIFALLGQELIALLQLLVFTGGLATFLIIAVATEEKNWKSQGAMHAKFLVLFSVIFAILAYFAVSLGPAYNAVYPSNVQSGAESAFSGSYMLLYAAMLLMFAAVTGSVLVLKKFAKIVI